jgi:tRNA threonylcarbamoyladenosine biosynthesis protein TsaE
MVMAQESDGAIAVSLADPTDTQAFAARLAPVARSGDVIALAGDLGTGKTTFARGFINALLVAHGLPPEDVPSPTFTLVQEYQLPDFTLFHIDLYRIETQSELFELGLEDAFADGVSLVEWPDRLGSLLPASWLELKFRQGDPGEDQDRRLVLLTAFGDWQDRIQTGALNG